MIVVEILKEGMIKSQFSMVSSPFEIRKLDSSSITDIVTIQSYDMKNEALFLPLTVEEIKQMLAKQGVMVGAFVDKKLVGYHSVFFPEEDEENIGRDINLSDENLNLVFHLEASFVIPEYRGNGLQKIMSLVLLDLVREMQHYRYLCETVSPNNIASIKSTLAIHTCIVNVKSKYDGKLRYIFFQDIFAPISVDRTTTVTISISDLAAQRALFAEGYYGYAITRKEFDTFILFAKCTNCI